MMHPVDRMLFISALLGPIAKLTGIDEKNRVTVQVDAGAALSWLKENRERPSPNAGGGA